MASTNNNSGFAQMLEDLEPYKKQHDLRELGYDLKKNAPLRTFDVIALIFNKMVGTGIYTAPATVFLMTSNKALTLGLFCVGFLYSVVSMALYLDFAEVLPFNGGELIYLDEITSYVSEPTPHTTSHPPAGGGNNTESSTRGPGTSEHNGQRQAVPSSPNAKTTATDQNTLRARVVRSTRALLGDGLLAFISYSIAFIIFFNSGSNSLQFGRMILLCVDDKASNKSTSPGDTNQDQNETSNEINRDLMRLIGVIVLTVICLLQYFSPGFGRSMNKTLAVIKFFSLVGLIVVAAIANKTSDSWLIIHPTEEEQNNNPNIGKPSFLAFAKALLAVLFSFEGWENATFVAGEIKVGKHHILRQGFIIAVITVGIMYITIVGLFLWAITWKDISDGHENINYPPMLTGGGIRARQAWAIVAAISSFGSLNAIIYTFSRVKQVIGQAEILPWSRYLKMDDTMQRAQKSSSNQPQNSAVLELQRDNGRLPKKEVPYKAPQGGLIAHWIMSVIVIAGSAGTPTTLEAAGLPGYIQTYVHCFFQGVLGIGFFKLRSREKALNRQLDDKSGRVKFRKCLRAFLSFTIPIYIILNAAILVINAIGPYKGTDGSVAAFKGYGFPIMVAGLLAISTTYYLLFFGAASRLYEPRVSINNGTASSSSAPSTEHRENGILNQESGFNLMKWANVRCEIRKNYIYDETLERVYRFGRRWRVIYFVPGDDSDVSSGIPPKVTFPMFLYWLFGGSRLNPGYNPGDIVSCWWKKQKKRFHKETKKGKPSSGSS